MIMDSYTEIAIRIVEQAAHDWRRAYRVCKKNRGDFVTRQHLFEIEDFFRSEWFKILTDYKLNGEEVLKILREQENAEEVKK